MQPVTEIGFFHSRPGREDDFLAAMNGAKHNTEISPGCLNLTIRQSLEMPTTFVLIVEWESLQAHLNFRATERLQAWRLPLAPLLGDDPSVEHYVLKGRSAPQASISIDSMNSSRPISLGSPSVPQCGQAKLNGTRSK